MIPFENKGLAALLIGLLVFTGCITTDHISNEKKPEKKVVGGQIKEIIDYTEIEKRDVRSSGLGFIGAGVYYAFVQDKVKKYFSFANVKIDAELGVHYFYIPYGRGGYVEKHSREDFDGWNLKINITDFIDKYGITEVYLMLDQDENEIKEMISKYRDKQLVDLNLSSLFESGSPDVKYTSEVWTKGKFLVVNGSSNSVGTNFETIFTADEYEMDKEQLLNSLLDVFSNFNYTNDNYAKMESGIQVGLEETSSEELVMKFSDNSSMKISYDSFAGIKLGSMEFEGNGFIFSLDTGEDYSTKNRLFYNAVVGAVS